MVWYHLRKVCTSDTVLGYSIIFLMAFQKFGRHLKWWHYGLIFFHFIWSLTAFVSAELCRFFPRLVNLHVVLCYCVISLVMSCYYLSVDTFVFYSFICPISLTELIIPEESSVANLSFLRSLTPRAVFSMTEAKYCREQYSSVLPQLSNLQRDE